MVVRSTGGGEERYGTAECGDEIFWGQDILSSATRQRVADDDIMSFYAAFANTGRE
jgi:hypothetical protein